MNDYSISISVKKIIKLKQCFLRTPKPSSLSATLKIMVHVLSYGDHLSNNILWAEMVIGRNGYGPKWSWTEMVMGPNDPEPLYNMSRDVRKQTFAFAKTKTRSRSESLFLLNG